MKDSYGEREFFEKYNIRTDLALESHEVIVEKEGPPELPGVKVDTEKTEYATISRVTVESDLGAQMMGKAPGHYSTIEAPILREHNREVQEDIAQLLAKELEWFMEQSGLGPEDGVLVVGLGNWNATPDALGPRVVENLMVTRHLLEMSPPELRKGLRPIAAISPGVLGLTGIETGEIIMGVSERIGAKAVICIDALASRSVERLCSTIQISDTGINPGAGVGNRRLPINLETLGVPVIAIGIPTVVHAVTIVSDALDLLEKGRIGNEETDYIPKRTEFPVDPDFLLGRRQMPVEPIREQDKRQLIGEVLEPYMGTMIVTPKEIDSLIDEVTDVVAGALNIAFHEGVDYDEVFQYLS
ncbi:MAG: GPR endopeptidase [Firmicutes bacterium]|nr:GPR endopeptidase [Bacillota bacterium]